MKGIILSGHGAYRTEYHIVWVTKYRRPVLNTARRDCLASLLGKILSDIPGCELVEHNILHDHVHLLILIPPKYSVSEIVGKIKAGLVVI